MADEMGAELERRQAAQALKAALLRLERRVSGCTDPTTIVSWVHGSVYDFILLHSKRTRLLVWGLYACLDPLKDRTECVEQSYRATLPWVL